MKRKKSKVKFESGPLFTEVQQSAGDLLKKFGITVNTSRLVMIQRIREYIDNQPNPHRTCNAILLKLGVKIQLDNSMRKARVYAMTAFDEALRQGTEFDPSTVLSIADTRLIKIERYLGREVVVDYNTVEKKTVSKSEIARKIYSENQDKPGKEVAAIIAEELGIERQAALGYYYSARRSLTV
jgi:hypothetical protein